MLHVRKKQGGAYLVLVAILLAVLIAVAGLALDVGRLLVMRTEMQNAVDAAALAAAAELNSETGAQQRARDAAINLLQQQSHHGRVNELLDATSLQDDEDFDPFEFFCSIGSYNDPDEPSAVAEFCSSTAPVEIYKYPAAVDEEAHYVRVTLSPELATDYFTVDLYFIPVLKAIGIPTDDFITLRVSALAGRHKYFCRFPPIAICDPWDDGDPDTYFRNNMVPGQQIKFKEIGGSGLWAEGNFGLLDPVTAQNGPDIYDFIANSGELGCETNFVTTEPGSSTGPTFSALNTRMGHYVGTYDVTNPSKYHIYEDFPPDVNVIDYGVDEDFPVADGKIGNGKWDVGTYWDTYHAGVPFPTALGSSKPPAGTFVNSPTRHQVYEWEIESTTNRPDMIGDNNVWDAGEDDDNPSSISSLATEGRRVFHVAILSCSSLGVKGNVTVPITGHDGYAKIFLTQFAEGPPWPSSAFYAEYMGWAEESDANYHVDIRLYE